MPLVQRGMPSIFGMVAAVLLSVAFNVSAQVSVPGSYSVSDNGAATYAVPIAVSPGVGGMEPKLTISYNSQAGNGPLGLGWTLSGLSAITRCPLTKAHDGVNRWIAWDSTDAYCLDGERLFPIKDPANPGAAVGSNGGNGTYYGAERENFSKIQSFTDAATASSGAAYFIVKTKAGLTMEYGRTADSRIEGQSRIAVRVWALNKVSDSKGNYFIVTYLEDSVNGQYYPTRIDYTANDTASTPIAATNSVVFDYGASTRPDIISAFNAGSAIKTTKLLRTVSTYANGSLVSSYAFTYAASAATGRSQLTQIDQQSATGVALIPIKITWTAGSKGLVNTGVKTSSPYGNWTGATSRIRAMDLDGDGKQDIVIGPDGGGNWYLLQSVGYGFANRNSIITGAYGGWDGSGDRIHAMDIDGDGRQDIVIGPDANGAWYWLQSTGTGLLDRGTMVTGAYGNWSSGNGRIRVIDVDGDGRQDLVLGPDGSGSWYWLQSNGAGFTNRGAMVTGAFGNWDGATNRVRLMDVDGDGQQDFVLGPDGSGTWYWFRGTDSGFVNKGALISGAYGNWDGGGVLPGTLAPGRPDLIRAFDLDGDGLQDILLGPDRSGNWYWLQSTGTNFIDRGAVASGYSGWFQASDRIRVTDTNADGLQDVLIGPDGAGNWYGLRSTGAALIDDGALLTGAYGGWDGSSNRILLMDVSGDGINDVVLGPDESGNWNLMLGTANQELIATIDNTAGLNPTAFTYGRLTDSAVYTKGSGSTYPIADVQTPMQVVRQAVTGVGGMANATTFTYGGLRVGYGPNARGLLGFNWNQSQQVNTGLTTRTYYRQDFPFLGMVDRTGKGTSAAAWSNLVLATNTYACNNFADPVAATCPVGPGKRYFVYASQSDEQGWDLTGAALPWLRTSQTMDNYGNPLTVTIDTLNPDGSASGHSKSTTSVYSNDLSNWYLGRLTRSTTTVTAPTVAPPVVPLSGG